MRIFANMIACMLAACSASGTSSDPSAKPVGLDPINYEMAIHLDAESLAETGMKEAYEKLQRQSSDIQVKWAPMREVWDGQDDGFGGGANYRVEVNGQVYPVFGSPPAKDAWAAASATFFTVVNNQLSDYPFKFYAINSGNELHAVRLTKAEFEQARISHKGSPYGPYVPNYTPPNYGLPE